MLTSDKSHDERSYVSIIPSETILSFLPYLGIHEEDIKGRNIMSVGEGIPFLANSLSSMGATVVAVDPLYKESPGDIYDKLLFIKTGVIGDLISFLGSDIPPFKQINKLQDVVNKGKDSFVKNFFNDTTTQFNDSFADNINNVEDRSQDFVILSFLLNNLETKDHVFDAIVESINKLKIGGKLIIIGPDNSNLTRSELDTLKKRYSFEQYVHDDIFTYRAYSFLKK